MSDSKKWAAMMSRKPELDLGGQARKIENQRVQIKRLTEKNENLHLALAHSKTRIEELEAEVARLRAELTKLELADAYLKDVGVSSANVHFGAREARAALNPGKDTP
jgi:predicted RNase H-like nuclease (RuvC/YqgF family)